MAKMPRYKCQPVKSVRVPTVDKASLLCSGRYKEKNCCRCKLGNQFSSDTTSSLFFSSLLSASPQPRLSSAQLSSVLFGSALYIFLSGSLRVIACNSRASV
ncbi:hypothetical protein Mapa_010538 [Marchantia paleacea]|nr:hypothetical protein Mapa_010538 [Marchantia paleacea]